MPTTNQEQLYTFDLVNGQPNVQLIMFNTEDPSWVGLKYPNGDMFTGFVQQFTYLQDPTISNRSFSPFVGHFLNGILHSLTEPAFIIKRNTGRIKATHWLKHGKNHREDGAAYYAPDGRCAYYLDGIELSLAAYYERQKNTIHAEKIMALILSSRTQ